MKIALIVSCVIAVSCAASMSHIDYEWESWKSQHGKSYYDDREEAIRRYIWEKNLAFVDQHNKEAKEGKHTFTVGMNRFADLETEEFTKMFLGLATKRPTNTPGCTNTSIYAQSHNYANTATEVDWRTKGYVTAIKDQAACGSCWAFSTTGSIEGQHFKKTGSLVSLSEQNLMDCSKPEGDFSCEGGMMDNAFDYVIANNGIDTEASYPYEARDDSKCSYTKANRGATISSCVDVTPHQDENALKLAVATVGPISVAIDASQQSFHLYQDGVYSSTECSSTFLDHGVLAIGYGTSDEGRDYWLVKNSWGVSWGMAGFIKMSRNANNQCGIATQASYPIV